MDEKFSSQSSRWKVNLLCSTALCCCPESGRHFADHRQKDDYKKKKIKAHFVDINFFLAKHGAQICSLFIYFPVIPGCPKIFVKDKRLPSGNLFLFPIMQLYSF